MNTCRLLGMKMHAVKATSILFSMSCLRVVTFMSEVRVNIFTPLELQRSKWRRMTRGHQRRWCGLNLMLRHQDVITSQSNVIGSYNDVLYLHGFLVGRLEIIFSTYGSLTMQRFAKRRLAGYVKYPYETIYFYTVLPAAVW